MTSTEIAKHDLSIVFDRQGRMWKFRATQGAHRPETHLPEHVTLDARMTAAGLVVTVGAPGIEPGDVEVNLEGNILYVNGKGGALSDLACTVCLPRMIAIATVQTAYADDVFEVYLPPQTKAHAKKASAVPVTAVSRETVAV